MRIYDLIEECNLSRQDLTKDHRYQIAQCYTDNEWIRAIEVFLRGISNQHQVIGKDVETLWGISDWYKEHEVLTLKQRIWISSCLIDNWDQLGIEMRARIY